ncbi:DUF4166 domain-containing protein [Lacisediminihabitans changchengi]|uniref:DUF4166 domain-containing protein n=1 Tax=Lacisediminihabitans changchengi TaxID=2787634 RepID=UPI001F450D82|nr:DUF4166 domain-containing protein [Lacisediminihabitans changchengi]
MARQNTTRLTGSNTAPSPYELVLGDELDALHPRLRAYFDGIPDGSTGVGSGVFERVGTPRLWLWPVLWLLEREGVLFPVWSARVPFTVRNCPVIDAAGNTAVLASREFRFSARRPFGRDREMTDAITAERGRLVDHLGTQRRYAARLRAEVVDGELHLVSTRVSVRFGRFAIPIPTSIAPVVRLVERFDAKSGLQHVSVVVESPRLGRLYEYAGSFSYSVVPGAW